MTNAQLCNICGSNLRQGLTFTFRNRVGETATKCLSCGLRHWPMLRRSLIIALIMGTLISLLNHGDSIFDGYWPNPLFWKVPLTYCAPFMVATIGALANARR